VAEALQKANGNRELCRFVLWVPFILDSLWTPLPCEDGLIRVAEVPDETTFEEKEQAEQAFGWGPLLLPDDPQASLRFQARPAESPRPQKVDTGMATTLQDALENLVTRLRHDWRILFEKEWDDPEGLDAHTINSLLAEQGPVFDLEASDERRRVKVRHPDPGKSAIPWTVWSKGWEHLVEVQKDKEAAANARPKFTDTLDYLRAWRDRLGNLTSVKSNATEVPVVEHERGNGGQADRKADKPKKNPRPLPENDDVRRLINRLNRELPGGKSMIEIALEFCEGSEKKAKSLLRQVRRYKHLLENV
jgi:hypothetical protein